MSIISKSVRGLRVLSCAALLAGSAMFASHASAATIYAIDDQNNLFTFDNLTPQNIITGKFITGLSASEHLVGIDFRPVNGLLYGIGTSNSLYTINPATGAATLVAPLSSGISGNSFGMDFNPAADAIRFVSDTDNNLAINPTTGVATVQTNLAYAAGDANAGKNPSIVGVGYSNNTNPAPASTTAYGIDSNTNSLVTIGNVAGSPNGPATGQLFTVGALGVDTNNLVGLDISQNNIAFAALDPVSSSASHLYAINLSTGAATDQGQIIGGVRVVDIALEPGVNFILPEPGSLLAISAFAMLAGSRRRKLA